MRKRGRRGGGRGERARRRAGIETGRKKEKAREEEGQTKREASVLFLVPIFLWEIKADRTFV